MVDLTALKTELTTDPKGLGYAANLTSTNDVANAALINATSGAGAAVVPLIAVPKGQLLLGITPLLMQLASGQTTAGATTSAATTAKWQMLFQALQAADPTLVVAQILPMLNDAVTDGLTTSTAVTALTTKTGSRAEVLWGAGTVIQWQDIAAAMGR